ncbi:MAG: hypothetical protein H0T75_01885 [Rhizobiales bacterium]|nr:hypothetical protein [Hyphomicrobiales bacterium]
MPPGAAQPNSNITRDGTLSFIVVIIGGLARSRMPLGSVPAISYAAGPRRRQSAEPRPALHTYDGVLAIWNLQTAGIVAGHVAAVALAHALALRHFGDTRRAMASQGPLALLMVLYTLLGLWLLSTPAAM